MLHFKLTCGCILFAIMLFRCSNIYNTQWGDKQMNSLSLTTDQCGDVTPLPEFNVPGTFLNGKCPEDLKLKS